MRHALKIRICPSDKIRLFGCRWWGAAERISMEIIVAEQHHRGSKRYITLPSHRSDSANNGISILEVFEILRVISSEKAFEFHYRNRT